MSNPLDSSPTTDDEEIQPQVERYSAVGVIPDTTPENSPKQQEDSPMHQQEEDRAIMLNERSRKVGSYEIFWWTETLPQKHLQLLKSINKYVDKRFVENVLIPLLEQNFEVSLRSLDWLVVNYAKKYNIVYYEPLTSTDLKGKTPSTDDLCDLEIDCCDLINLFSRYRDTLNEWRRKRFDPFRRRQRIRLTWKDRDYETTIGQIHFLSWADRFHVLHFAKWYITSIEKEMNDSLKQSRKEKQICHQRGVKRKRKQLTSRPNSKCRIYPVATRVHFST